MAGIPPKSVSTSDRDRSRRLDSELKQVIFGQDQAIESLVAAIKLSRSGLGAPEKPIGSFLFSGPTGVGKTELARQPARILGIEFIRFDMSEYMEKHTVSRLIGAPPGYVGFDQGGLLTDAIRRTPHAVLVLDEIEKAHPDIFNILFTIGLFFGVPVQEIGQPLDCGGHSRHGEHVHCWEPLKVLTVLRNLPRFVLSELLSMLLQPINNKLKVVDKG